jgi:lysyl-tRNA synthetase class 2
MSDEENELIAQRREKLEVLAKRNGLYPNDFKRDALALDLHARFADEDKKSLEKLSSEVSVAGRVMLRRVMGKASFITLQDGSGSIQCYITKDHVGDDAYRDFDKLWDLGDIVGVRGKMMRTNRGELTVDASEIRLLAKALRPPPEKFHGLSDHEIRYRQRYLDLMVNETTRRVFTMRTRIVDAMREFMRERGFLEVETPMMQAIPGGATARPFVTHHNALDIDLYLRVAPELYLKRLVIGGFDRVFEINRNFRNEGLSPKHNPEFTMLECYQAFADYEDLMALTESLIRYVAQDVLGSTRISFQGTEVDFGEPIPRLTLFDALLKYTRYDEAALKDLQKLHGIAEDLELEPKADWGVGRLQMEIFDAVVEDQLTTPVFITQHPTEVSPLARRNADDPEVTDRFELFTYGRELANGFSELNDPEDQAKRFEEQAKQAASGDLDAMRYDADYVEALEYGMPPTGGTGVGVDRVVMLFTDSPSIRDVLLFPHMRPKR